MTKNKLIFIIAILIVAGVYWLSDSRRDDKVDSLEINSKKELIVVDSPVVGSVVKSPLSISGMARGYWFFEASFPVSLTDDSGAVLSQGIATAKSEWMTTDFVPFSAVLEFEKPVSAKSGVLILKKDNPSGLPEHDDQIEIPIIFE